MACDTGSRGNAKKAHMVFSYSFGWLTKSMHPITGTPMMIHILGEETLLKQSKLFPRIKKSSYQRPECLFILINFANPSNRISITAFYISMHIYVCVYLCNIDVNLGYIHTHTQWYLLFSYNVLFWSSWGNFLSDRDIKKSCAIKD